MQRQPHADRGENRGQETDDDYIFFVFVCLLFVSVSNSSHDNNILISKYEIKKDVKIQLTSF